MAGVSIRLKGRTYEFELPYYLRSMDGSIYVKIIDLYTTQLVGAGDDLALFQILYDEDISQWFDTYKYHPSNEKEFDLGVSAALGQCINLAAQLSNP